MKRYNINKLKIKILIELIVTIMLLITFVSFLIVGYILDEIVIAASSLIFLFLTILLISFTLSSFNKLRGENYCKKIEDDIEYFKRKNETSLALIYSLYIDGIKEKLESDKYDVYTYINDENQTLEIDLIKEDYELNIKLSNQGIKYTYNADIRKLCGYDVRWKKIDIKFNSEEEIINLIKDMGDKYLK